MKIRFQLFPHRPRHEQHARRAEKIRSEYIKRDQTVKKSKSVEKVNGFSGNYTKVCVRVRGISYTKNRPGKSREN